MSACGIRNAGKNLRPRPRPEGTTERGHGASILDFAVKQLDMTHVPQTRPHQISAMRPRDARLKIWDLACRNVVLTLVAGDGAVQGRLHRQTEGAGEYLPHPAQSQEYGPPLQGQGHHFPGVPGGRPPEAGAALADCAYPVSGLILGELICLDGISHTAKFWRLQPMV